MNVDMQEAERIKYEKVWSNRDYAAQADGEPLVNLAFDLMGCKRGQSLIDWGCGCGRPAAKFQAKGLKVTGVDIAHNCRDSNLDFSFSLVVACMWQQCIVNVVPLADYAFCTDVLEHLPIDRVDDSLKNIRACTLRAAFIQVCILPDIWGKRMNPPTTLHLTVMPGEWWLAKLQKYWSTVELVRVGGKARRAFLCR